MLLSHLNDIPDETRLRLLHQLLRFRRVVADTYSSCGTQDECRQSVPSLVNPASCQSGVVCLFLQPLLARHVRGPFSNFTQGAPKVSNQQAKSPRNRP